jgi:O-antigen ligase
VTLLTVALAFGILTLWIPQEWPWRLVQLALFAGAALQSWRRRIAPFASLASIGLLAAAAWGFLQAAAGLSVYPWATIDRALIWLAWWAAFALASALPRRHSLDHAAVFSAVLATAATVFPFTTPGKAFGLFETGQKPGVWGPFVYANQYAAFVLLTLPLVLTRALFPSPARIAWIAAAAAMAASVVASGSTAGTLLLTAELLVLLLRARAYRLTAALAVLIAVFVAATGAAALLEKLNRNDPLYARRMAAASTVDMIRDRPVTGFGMGTWNLVYPAYARFDDGLFDNQAHNDWLQWAAEGGLPFLALLLAIALRLTPALWSSYWATGLLFVWLHCLIEFHFQQRHAFGALFWAMAGWALQHRRCEKMEE